MHLEPAEEQLDLPAPVAVDLAHQVCRQVGAVGQEPRSRARGSWRRRCALPAVSPQRGPVAAIAGEHAGGIREHLHFLILLRQRRSFRVVNFWLVLILEDEVGLQSSIAWR